MQTLFTLNIILQGLSQAQLPNVFEAFILSCIQYASPAGIDMHLKHTLRAFKKASRG